MSRRVPLGTVAIVAGTTMFAFCLAPGLATAQAADGNADALVLNALSAAPASVAKGATVVDHQHNVIRKGTNGWTCMPDDPAVPNNSPMCLDTPWMDFLAALMAKRAPRVAGLGIGYMLQDDMPVSNVDPEARGPSETNQWLANGGPHIMLIVPDTAALATLSSDARSGGPWVMWRGTPYAHVMIPAVPRQR